MLSKVSAMTASKPALRASIPDEDYDESADDDFNPTQAAADEDAPSSSSEDDNEADKPVAIAKSKKRKVADDELDSGDEATIKERRKRRRRRDDKDDESGGEGGSIRTRAQRQAEYDMTHVPPASQSTLMCMCVGRWSGSSIARLCRAS